MAGFSLLALSLVLAAAGTGVQVAGQLKAGNAAKRAGEAGQRAADSVGELHDYNAAVADLQAADALERGVEDETRFRSQVKGIIGSQRAGIAASGTDVNYGSAVDVQADAAYLGELDSLQIRNNAAREAWGYKVAATDFRKRGEISRKEGVVLAAAGREQQQASRIAAAGTIIGTGSSLLEARYGFNRATAISPGAGASRVAPARSYHPKGAGD